MNCGAQEIVDAIITAAVRRGSDGRGKDGLDGHMSKLARTNRRRFGILLGRALRLKMKAKPDERDRLGSNKYIITREEAEARLREHGIPVEVLQFMRHPSLEEVLADPPESAEPNGTRDLMEAVFNAAIRHGSDGHGKDGLLGYMRLLQRTEPSTFDKLTGIAQRWQASRSDEPKPELRLTREQALADLRARGMDVDGYLEWESQRLQHELDPGEVEDRWGVKADE